MSWRVKVKQAQCGSAGNVQTLSSVALRGVFLQDKRHFAHTWHLLKTITGAVGFEPVSLNLHVWTQHIWGDRNKAKTVQISRTRCGKQLAAGAATRRVASLVPLWNSNLALSLGPTTADFNEGSADVRRARVVFGDGAPPASTRTARLDTDIGYLTVAGRRRCSLTPDGAASRRRVTARAPVKGRVSGGAHLQAWGRRWDSLIFQHMRTSRMAMTEGKATVTSWAFLGSTSSTPSCATACLLPHRCFSTKLYDWVNIRIHCSIHSACWALGIFIVWHSDNNETFLLYSQNALKPISCSPFSFFLVFYCFYWDQNWTIVCCCSVGTNLLFLANGRTWYWPAICAAITGVKRFFYFSLNLEAASETDSRAASGQNTGWVHVNGWALQVTMKVQDSCKWVQYM